MNFIKIPNLPKESVSLFIADTVIEGADVIRPAALSSLSPALSHHADLGICHIGENTAVCPPDSFDYYKEKLSPHGFQIIKGKTSLSCHYPKDSAYNVGIVGKKCFLNKNVCDAALFDILTSVGYEIVNVKQGYGKCSICPINENSFITGDMSIYKAGIACGMDVLLVANDGIELTGYSNGFFGGCTGLFDKNTLLINGELDFFPGGKKVMEFLNNKNISIKSLKKGALTDIGSIIPLMNT